MNTLTNAYLSKLSSGTITALLLFSGLLFLVPVAVPTFAAQNASLPTLSEVPNVLINGASTSVSVTVSNPVGNAYAITSVTLVAPSSWSFASLDSCPTGLATTTYSTGAVTCSGTAGILPGYSGSIGVHITGPSSPATSAAPTGVFSTTLVDGGSAGAYAGPTFTLYSVATGSNVIGYTVSPALTSSNFVAGSSALTVTATVGSGQQGVPVTFAFTSVTTTSGFTNTVSPSSGLTGSSGTVAATWTPSNAATDRATLNFYLGTTASSSGNTGAVTTIAGAPSTVTVTAGGSSTKTDYVTAFGTPGYATSGNYAKVASGGITGAVADAFGNAVTSGITYTGGQGCTLTGFGGSFDNAGTAASTNSPAAGGGSCSTSGAIASTLNYYQAGAFGTTSYVQVTVTGTYSSSSFAASGNSKTLSTSTFDSGTSLTPTTSPAAGSISAGSASGVVSTITVTYALTNAQAGVPVTFFGVNSTSPYAGSFVGGNGPSFHPVGNPARLSYANITVTTVIGGSCATSTTACAIATFTIDPTYGSAVAFKAKVAAPITGTPSNTLALSSATGTFTTTYGAASKLLVKGYFTSALGSPTSKAIAGQTIYLDVILSDYWGNTVSNNGGQVQMNLAASPSSAGTFSATSVYIKTGSTDTYGSFGTITFVVSSSAALGAVTLTATGFYSGSGTLTIVSPNPTITVNTPTNSAQLTVLGHTIYSGLAGVGFSGTAAVSAGVYPAPTISNIYYTVDGGATQNAGTSSPWSFVATLSAGLHTIVVWAKDSTGALSSTNSTTVLVDTSAPTIAAPTTLSYGSGTPVVFTITDSLGDLKASSVTVSVNGTALTEGASSGQTFTVTGTNNPGSSATYTVSVTGLTASSGHYGITVGARDLAGNAATAVTAVVRVTVSFAQSVVVSGTPAKATVGGFTGIQVSYTNGWTSSQNLIVFAVWKNSAGQTVAVTTSGLTLAAGATGTAFAPLAGTLPTGSYTVNIFVWTTSNNSVSSTTTISASF